MLKFRVTIGCLRSKKYFDHAGVPYHDMALEPYIMIGHAGQCARAIIHDTGGAAPLNHPHAVAQMCNGTALNLFIPYNGKGCGGKTLDSSMPFHRESSYFTSLDFANQ